ncbi:hypothetical protein M0R45_032468 [Rubus argutus]|uniref:Eukaryotic translation initiation factor 3 subunit B n=1 Tax=Rubus argutus TaxID=59490 RepID=A0AAW1WGM0_RUBAR
MTDVMALHASTEIPPGEIISSDDEENVLEEDLGFGNIILVDNLPVVSREKFEKLVSLIRGIYGRFGTIKEDWMPHDPNNNKSLGYCFIEYNTPQEAELAKEKTNGEELLPGWTHKFAVNMVDDLAVPGTEVAKEITPEHSVDGFAAGGNLQHWLTDEKVRDQFVICAGSDTEVLWNDAQYLKSELFHKRNLWNEDFVQWSPLGTYLATVHREGAAIWGGASTFNHLMHYAHPQVSMIDFSPGEKYLVTYSRHKSSNSSDANTIHQVEVNIFDVRTGKVRRNGTLNDFALGGPIFKWAGGKDDKYFARMGKNILSVYETETFLLVGKKSIKAENAVDFSWSPTDTILALFAHESGSDNKPARVTLVQIPDKKELRQKNLFGVSDCKMYWQSNGEYLAVQVERHTKTKKSTYTSFELFRMKERDIPIEVLELENKNDKIIAFSWEPKGHRFAVIHGDNTRPDISFYSMRSAHNTSRISKLTTLKGKQANALFWSPSGRFIVLAGLKDFKGQLEFFNVDELETMATTEHYMATDIEWDPSGRYIATAVTSIHHMDSGLNILSFSGKLLYQILKDDVFQFFWRPRPPSILSPEKEEEIAKNLKKYSEKYKEKDKEVPKLLREKARGKRRMLQEEWEQWESRWQRLHEEDKLERLKLRDGEDSDEEKEEFEAQELEIEELLDVIEEVVSFDD